MAQSVKCIDSRLTVESYSIDDGSTVTVPIIVLLGQRLHQRIAGIDVKHERDFGVEFVG